MESWQYSPSAVTVPQLVVDPYRFPGIDALESPLYDALPCGPVDTDWQPRPLGEVGPSTPWPAPDDAQRLAWPLAPEDRRRLDLHAALTAAGIAPLPGDLAVIEALSALDDTTNAVLQRWITAGL